MSLFKQLKEVFKLDLADIAELDNLQAQQQLHLRLRHVVNEQLRKPQKESLAPNAVARLELEKPDTDSRLSYLVEQNNDEARAGDIEAEALAEILGCHLDIRAYTEARATYTEEVREIPSNNNAKVIRLDNDNNRHWSYRGVYTEGDGNCLYNAFALAIRDFCREEIRLQSAMSAESSSEESINLGLSSESDWSSDSEDSDVEDVVIGSKSRQPIPSREYNPHRFFKSTEEVAPILRSQREMAKRLNLDIDPNYIPDLNDLDVQLALKIAAEEMSKANRR